MTRRTLLALGALFLSSTLPVREAHSAPAYPDMRASYFGSFTSNRNITLYSELNIDLHVKKLVSGTFNMGAVLRDVLFEGKCERSGRFTVTGMVREGGRRLRIRLEGKFNPGGNGELATLTGRYQISGPRRERGTFRFSGPSNLP